MKKRERALRLIKALLCTILILTLFVVVVLPHNHGSSEAECALCGFAETLKKLASAAFLTFLAGYICDSFLSDLAVYRLNNTNAAFNPVRLKVKLSD